MDLNPSIIAIPLYFVLIGLELLYDRIRNARLYRLSDSLTNINAGASQQVVGVIMHLIPLSIYELVYHNFNLGLVVNEPFTWLNFCILFVAYDFCYYWAHRMSHQINLFWSAHVVHHQSEEYNLSVALRQSWFQGVWTAPFYIPLALVGFSTENVLYVSGINLIYQFWIHTEAVDRMGFLEWFMNTPSHHRVHHGRNPKYIDKNHAGVFIIWDKLFGTFQIEEERPTYGITVPVNSWNPIWANFSHFQLIKEELAQTPKFADKLKVVFFPPGWQALRAGYQIPEVDRSIPKYDIPVTSPVQFYAIFQYISTTILTALYLFSQHKLDINQKIIGAIFIVWAILNLGGILEKKKLYHYSELLRYAVGAILLYFYIF